MAGPLPYPESSPQNPYAAPGGPPFPAQGGQFQPAMPYPEQVPSHYPGALPPPVPYPKPSRRRPLMIVGIGVLVALLIAALVTTAVVLSGSDDAADTLSPDRARAAIQTYLDALSNGNNETIARNASCGLFDEIQDRQADMSLANLASDAFRRQYKSAEVASIDKVVSWSPNQSQVLFTMKVQAARTQGSAERQAIAQILVQGNDTLVCSYLPRTGQF